MFNYVWKWNQKKNKIKQNKTKTKRNDVALAEHKLNDLSKVDKFNPNFLRPPRCWQLCDAVHVRISKTE